jgi:hypothetical protein
MSNDELQIQNTDRNYDRMIREIEQQDPNVLNSVVEGSRLHRVIHSPVTEGIDEG